MKALKPNSLLVTFSCSGHIEEDLFKKIIVSASEEAEREVHFLRTLQQAHDHPVVSFFPESHYLKGFLLYVRQLTEKTLKCLQLLVFYRGATYESPDLVILY